MGHLFSKIFHRDGQHPKKSNKVTEHDKAVLDLKNQRDKLKQYQKRIQTVLEREVEIAKELLKQAKKDKALLALKKKKYQEQLLNKTESQLNNVQQMIDSLEFAEVEKKIFEQLKLGTKALQDIQKEMSVEAVEKLMEESREAIEYQEEISRMLGENLTTSDIADVASEFDQLQAQMLGEQLSNVKTVEEKIETIAPEENVEETQIEEEENKKEVLVV